MPKAEDWRPFVVIQNPGQQQGVPAGSRRSCRRQYRSRQFPAEMDAKEKFQRYRRASVAKQVFLEGSQRQRKAGESCQLGERGCAGHAMPLLQRRFRVDGRRVDGLRSTHADPEPAADEAGSVDSAGSVPSA